MSCNSESRRAINYSLQEPINNKYDLWLSENLRYNSEGSLIYDSPGQPACDFILKIYKDGDWKPIAGLSTEHIVANKINIVDGVNYTYISPNDNTLHVNNGFQQNHLPLFRDPQDTPNELFDAGTLGEAIYGFVNETEWLLIFEGDAFTEAFEQYFTTEINEGNININNFIELATTEQIGGILSDTHESQMVYPFKPVEVKFYPSSWLNNLYNGRLSVNAWDVQEALNEIWQEHPGSELISGWKGIETLLRDGLQGIWVGLSGVTTENTGRFCTIQLDNTDPSGATINWVDLSNIYPVLSVNSSRDIEYVINGGGGKGTYLDYNGEWTVPYTNEYHGGYFINVSLSNVIDIRPYAERDTRKFYICSENEHVSWQPINTGITYVLGVGITIGNLDNTINIKTDGATEGLVLSYDGDGDVEWITVLTGLTYTEGNGIDIDSNTILCNIETIDEGTPGGSLNVSWTTLRDSILITDNSTYNKSIGLYEVYYNDTRTDYTFSLVNYGAQFENNNPIYLRLNIKNLHLTDGTKYIGDTTGNGEYLVTIQFGVIKFEVINTHSEPSL